MERFIIIYEDVINGGSKIMYHKSIALTDKKKGCMNVYTEEITTNRKEAMVFFEQSEALAVAAMFENDKHIAMVATKLS